MKFIKNLITKIMFTYGMMRLSSSLWKDRMSIKASASQPVIIVHYDSDKINNQKAALLSPEIEKKISDPFTRIHGYPPFVLMMPFGMTFSTINWSDVIDMLHTTQRTDIQNALYRKKGKIVISE